MENMEKSVIKKTEARRGTGDLISIIIPVYNAGRYLDDCIKSVQEQTYRRFEVLLVDDGSTDKSADLCGGICKADKRFRFLPREHRGVSSARNEGMAAARGCYFFFLDSDDAIHPRLLEVLYRIIKKTHSAMAGAGYLMTDGDNMPKAPEKGGQAVPYTVLKNEEALACFPFEMQDYFFFTIGGKLVSRNAAESVRFHTALSNAEDTLFLYQVLLRGGDVVVLHERWYYYRRRGSGAGMARTVKAYQDQYRVYRSIRRQEEVRGRLANAVFWEDFIIRSLLSWRLANYHTKNEKLRRYLALIMRKQKDVELFAGVRPDVKMRYYAALCFFPLYRWMFLRMLHFAGRRKQEAALLPRKYRGRRRKVYIAAFHGEDESDIHYHSRL